MSAVHVFDGTGVRAVVAPSTRPLRWAAWQPSGGPALLVGNRGETLTFDGTSFAKLESGSAHNLRGAAWSPAGDRALLVGNRGAVLLFDGTRFREIAPCTPENLRRVAWHPDGGYALIIGNGGVTLRYDAANGALYQLPADRAHTLRSIAWRPDGAYALIGAYASSYAGYPRPHALYRCDGRFVQGIYATDDDDDTLAIDWRPNVSPACAMVLVASYGNNGRVTHKLVEYNGAGIRSSLIESPAALLGAAWHPDGGYALFCGESGTLLRGDGADMTAVSSATSDNLVGPFWRPDGAMGLMLKGPDERVYTV